MWKTIAILLTVVFIPAFSVGPAFAGEEASLMNGAIPLMANARVVDEKIEGQSGWFVLEIPTDAAEVVDYYRQAMADKGWPPGHVHTIGDMGTIMLQDGSRQFALKAKFKDGVSTVRMTLLSQ